MLNSGKLQNSLMNLLIENVTGVRRRQIVISHHPSSLLCVEVSVTHEELALERESNLPVNTCKHVLRGLV